MNLYPADLSRLLHQGFGTTCQKSFDCGPLWTDLNQDCAVPKNIHTPSTEGIGISWGVRGSGRPKYLKKFMKLNWKFQRGWRGGGGVLEKIPSVEDVWIFSGTTH